MELVVYFGHRDTGSETRGTIKAEDALDSKLAKDEITSVMAIGEKYLLRKDKYDILKNN